MPVLFLLQIQVIKFKDTVIYLQDESNFLYCLYFDNSTEKQIKKIVVNIIFEIYLDPFHKLKNILITLDLSNTMLLNITILDQNECCKGE